MAANWQDWSRSFKIVLLLSLFFGINITGFHLWRRPAALAGQQRLGQGLLLLGAMILGANISLMSQMFHQSGPLYELFLVWGLGVLIMAYSLRLTSLGVMALLLVGMGYWGGWFAANDRSLQGLQLLVIHMPLVAMLFVPLAYWCRSQALFGLSAALTVMSFTFNLRPLSMLSGFLLSSGWGTALAFTLPPALLWSYHHASWQARQRSQETEVFQPLARTLALWFLAIAFYTLSFQFLWTTPNTGYYPNLAIWQWQVLIDVLVLSVLTGLSGLHELRSARQQRWRGHTLHTGSVAVMLLLTAVMVIWHIDFQPIPLITILAFNGLLFYLSIALVRDGLAFGDRATFWGGTTLLVLGISTRMLEYQTGLLLKSIVFCLCGIGVILAGLWFERHSTRQRTST